MKIHSGPRVRVIVAGSRSFDDYKLLCDTLAVQLIGLPKSDIEIVSGGARGADTLAHRYAVDNGLAFKLFPPDWSRGKRAGYERNEQMAVYADVCVVFWDGVSKGTSHMIDLARKHNLSLTSIRFA